MSRRFLHSGWWLSAPFLGAAVFLVAVPLVSTLWLATQRYDGIAPADAVGLANFEAIFTDPLFSQALDNSLIFAALSVPLRMAIAFGLALLLARQLPFGGLFRSLVYLPAVLPEIAFALAWLWILNPLHGPVTLLSHLGLAPGAWLTDPWSARFALVAMTLLQVGELFLVLLAVRRQLPEELYEVCALEGGSAWTAFRQITLPLLLPVLILLGARDVALSLQATFVPALVVTKGGPNYATLFLPLYVYQTGFEYLRFGAAAAMTVFILAITAAMVALQASVLNLLRGR